MPEYEDGAAGDPAGSGKHHMRSPAARKAQARRMKLYWAKKKKLGK